MLVAPTMTADFAPKSTPSLRAGDRRCPRGGIVRAARRPAGWIAPGPAPRGPGDDVEDWPGPHEDLCFLSGDWRVFQRTDGHRWSLDDLVTAWVAVDTARNRTSPIRRACDLGCGIGSVLMMVAWSLPRSSMVGIEAQAISIGLARRSVRYNGADDRVELRHGDLRDPQVTADGQVFDLVTGTPPYFDTADGVVSTHVQRGPCRFELRGGIEAYFEAADRIVAPGGTFVVCEDARQAARVEAAAAGSGLRVVDRLDVVPREGKPPLFSVFTCRREPSESTGSNAAPDHPRSLLVRRRDGSRTAEFTSLRRTMGLPR